MEFNFNSDHLSIRTLEGQAALLSQAISARKVTDKAAAQSALNDLAESRGFTLAELVGTAAPAASVKPACAAKYMDPENNENLWSGRGRQPQWFKGHIATGTSAESMLIVGT